MKTSRFLSAVMLFVALSFGLVSCEYERYEGEPLKEPTPPSNNDETIGSEENSQITITVLSSDFEMGEVTGSGVYDIDTEVTITAIPREGYYFSKWSDGVTDNPRRITTMTDASYMAIFAPNGGINNGYTWVDLGLSVKWAICNVGAINPEGYGSYFAWGETTTKSIYDNSTYTYSINPAALPLGNDAVAVNMGGSWRMPTYHELDELCTECIWTWSTLNGVNGYEVKSKINDNYIFLPAAGYRINSNLEGIGQYGLYWSNLNVPNSSICAYYIYLQYGSVYWNSGAERCHGLSVRGVCE